MQSSALKKTIRVAHSPDADDAFMFYALAEKIIEDEKFHIEHILKDIQSLNKEAKSSRKYDIQAISFYAYPEIENEYQLLSCGGSVGYGYGPILVARDQKSEIRDLSSRVIAVPGENTTAFLLLKLLLKDFKYEVVPFDEIIDAVLESKYDYGLLIHEGQLSYKKHGLYKVVDLGEWWLGKTNLPVPLGGNVIKRNYSEEEKKELNLLIKRSITYALQNKEKVIPAISKYARELNSNHVMVNQFVSMYVNEFTLDYGISGKLAIKKLYQMAQEDGLIKKIPKLDFVD